MGGSTLLTNSSGVTVSYRGIVESMEMDEEEETVLDKEASEELGKDGKSGDRRSGLVLSNS